LKLKLKKLSQEVADSASSSNEEKLKTFTGVMASLKGLITELNTPVDNVRLLKLRSVRSYKETLDNSNKIWNELEDNQAQLDKLRQTVANVIWFFNNQELSTRSLEKQDPELFHQWFLTAKEEWNNFHENRGGTFRAPDQPLNNVLEKTFKSEEPQINYLSYLFTLLPILLVVGFLYFIFSRQMKGMGNNAMNFGKSPARLMTKEKNKITFKDVAGIDEAIEELEEIVEFLKNPQHWTSRNR
jgi:cell division protease FtsH